MNVFENDSYFPLFEFLQHFLLVWNKTLPLTVRTSNLICMIVEKLCSANFELFPHLTFIFIVFLACPQQNFVILRRIDLKLCLFIAIFGSAVCKNCNSTICCLELFPF